MHTRRRRRARREDRHRHRLPLLVSFGVVSLALSVVLGVALSLEIQRSVTDRSLQALRTTTRSAIALTVNTIISGMSTSQGGIPGATSQQQSQVSIIQSASQVLVADSDIVAVEAVLANGLVIGGANAPQIGTTIALDDGLRAALNGATQVRTVAAASRSAPSLARPLLRKYGDLLEFDQGVRMVPGGPILGVVRSYAPLGPARAQAAADARQIITLLALGLIVFWLALFRLVLGASKALSRQSKANAYQATHDVLTGLPNRVLLRDRTDRAVIASRRSGVHVALVLMDLDRFKEVNDTLGHPYGDMLLKQIGPRLREHLRDADTVARIGGDEFVVLLPDLRSPEMARTVAEKLIAALLQPFVLDGVAVDVGTSAGVATTPDHGDDFDELLQHADVAMYLAKQDSLGAVEYADELDPHSPARLSLLADLRGAVDQPDQIVLHYQPQADTTSGAIVGVEALVRWHHPDHGMVRPDEFIPLAERTGIIRPLTWCILREALEQNRRWAEAGLVISVSVNISARCLLEDGFADGIARLLTETGVPADRLDLELTETVVMTDADRALAVLEALAARGISLSIDDFGTGYSSMAYLKRLPVHVIKIDRTFVTRMDTDASDAAIVRSSLELARNLDLTVVAEGVETREVWDQLRDLGCAVVQGYFLSPPLPAAEVFGWITSRLSSIES